MRRRRGSLDVTVTDQFCGAGGSSEGAESAGATVRLAMNHWKVACATYNTNRPDTSVVCADISATDPRRYPSTDILITSPECTNHSGAKRRPKAHDPRRPTLWAPTEEEERSRATMWDVPRFAEYHDYELIVVENVVEAAKWTLFPAWLSAMEALGYAGQPVYLNSMVAHPTPQSRDRMYYVFWKRGNGAPDLDFAVAAWCPGCEAEVAAVQWWKPPTKAWPLPTWGRYRAQYLYRCPSCSTEALPYAYPASSAIDWSIPAERIGDRSEPLRPATMARIAKGLERFGTEAFLAVLRSARPRALATVDPLATVVGGAVGHALVVPTDRGNDPDSKRARWAYEPGPTQTGRRDLGVAMVVPMRRGGRARFADDPMATVTTAGGGGQTLVGLPFVAELRGGGSGARAVVDPLATVTAAGTHHGLVQPPGFVVKGYGSVDSSLGCMAKSLGEPLGAVTARDHHGVVGMPFLSGYYGRGGARGVDQPTPTLATRHHHALVEPGPTPAIEDCTFRMLEPAEIGRAMAFPDSYRVLGNKRQRVRQYGNAVTPPAMAMIVERCIASLEPGGRSG